MPTYKNVKNGVEIVAESELSGDWELVTEKKTPNKKVEDNVTEDDEE